MTWSNILNTHPVTIKKKMDWYDKQKAQTDLTEFLEDNKDNEKRD